MVLIITINVNGLNPLINLSSNWGRKKERGRRRRRREDKGRVRGGRGGERKEERERENPIRQPLWKTI